jgi:DNA-binding response OmpR family regulator
MGGEKSIITNSKKKILIVDDEPDINFALKIVLEENGYDEVTTFTNPHLALDSFRKGLYDLLILDIRMPKMNGFELYERMKKIDNKAKVCFLTAGERDRGSHREIFEENQFIRKPIENKELLMIVNEIINK